jgi:hypothetical protein
MSGAVALVALGTLLGAATLPVVVMLVARLN